MTNKNYFDDLRMNFFEECTDLPEVHLAEDLDDFVVTNWW